MSTRRIEIGAIAAAHGIRGQFKVKAFSDDPMDVASYGSVWLDDGRQLSLKAHSKAKQFVLCSAKEVTSREMAEALRGQLLYVGRDQLPEAAEDEIYHADIIGFDLMARALDKEGAVKIGAIIGLYDFGAGTVIEVKQKGKKTIMVPFGDAYEPEIDEAQKCLIMTVSPAWLAQTDAKDDQDERKANTK